MNHPLYPPNINPINIPVSFSYSQVHQNEIPSRFLPGRINPPTIITRDPPLHQPIKSTSQIIYPTHTVPHFTSSVPFHHSQLNEPKILSSRPQIGKTQNVSYNLAQNKPNPMQNVLSRNLSDYRRNVSPLNANCVEISPRMNILSKEKDLQKYDALRWQNKYEDLKTKYFELLSIVENHSHVQDSWLLEEQNKLLRQKVRLLQEKDQKYYNQVATRIQKMIEFHKQTTTQQCALLIDRYRLENKYLQKI